ncbi:hypothetical protein F5B17DRAFT_384582 [Nemania serpens]|nr:hypothetical protein F5B17DRAFT_384582 [Nemania serpens]
MSLNKSYVLSALGLGLPLVMVSGTQVSSNQMKVNHYFLAVLMRIKQIAEHHLALLGIEPNQYHTLSNKYATVTHESLRQCSRGNAIPCYNLQLLGIIP